MESDITKNELLQEISKHAQLINKKMNIYDIISLFLENNQSEDPFFIVNIGDVIRQYEKWEKYLPLVKPFYAVKCNPDLIILKILAKLGCNFDCASKNEIAKILDMDILPDRIIFANPCKMISQLKYARAHNCDLLTFDCENELYKIKLYHPEADLIIRIKTDDSGSLCQFSSKFGAEISDIDNILKKSIELNLKIVGISFHVGSGCNNIELYDTAIRNCRQVYDIAEKMGINITIVDIGGGFPGVDTETVKFESIANIINRSIEDNFSDKKIRFIAEPGRFMVSSCSVLVLSVINKKVHLDPITKEKKIIYYVNDGVYSSFSNIIMDHFVVNENNLFPYNERFHNKNDSCQRYPSCLFGPTCDSIDKITDQVMLPDLANEEVLFAVNMGAYTNAAINGQVVFNGFNKTQSKYIIN